MNLTPKERVITIDGPAGVGKSTVSKLVAQKLGFRVLHSGVVYRAAAYLQSQGACKDNEKHSRFDMTRISFNGDQLLISGSEPPQKLWSEEMGKRASEIAKIPAVRRDVNRILQNQVGTQGIVAEGRDMGSVVFPEAKLKIYMDASEDARATRIASDTRRTHQGSLFAIRTAIIERDERDRTRECAPLTDAIPGAITIDTTMMNVDQVVNEIIRLWHEANA